MKIRRRSLTSARPRTQALTCSRAAAQYGRRPRMAGSFDFTKAHPSRRNNNAFGSWDVIHADTAYVPHNSNAPPFTAAHAPASAHSPFLARCGKLPPDRELEISSSAQKTIEGKRDENIQPMGLDSRRHLGGGRNGLFPSAGKQ